MIPSTRLRGMKKGIFNPPLVRAAEAFEKWAPGIAWQLRRCPGADVPPVTVMRLQQPAFCVRKAPEQGSRFGGAANSSTRGRDGSGCCHALKPPVSVATPRHLELAFLGA